MVDSLKLIICPNRFVIILIHFRNELKISLDSWNFVILFFWIKIENWTIEFRNRCLFFYVNENCIYKTPKTNEKCRAIDLNRFFLINVGLPVNQFANDDQASISVKYKNQRNDFRQWQYHSYGWVSFKILKCIYRKNEPFVI